jgi:hypothetical protein
MMSNIASHLHILAAPWQQRRTEKSFGAIITIVLLLLITGGVIGFFLGGDGQSMKKSYASITAGGVVVLWLMQILYMNVLNHPVHARLVPGHRRKFRQTVLAFWLGTSLLVGLTMGWVFGDGLKWSFFAAYVEVICVVAMLSPWRWLLVCCVFVSPWWPREFVTSLFQDFLRPFSFNWSILGLSLLLLPCSYILTHMLIRSGNANYMRDAQKWRRFRGAMELATQGRHPSIHQFGSKWTSITNALLYPMHRYMQHLVATPQRTAPHVLARAEFVLGTEAHWVTQACVLIGITLLALAMGVVEGIQHGFVWRHDMNGASFLVAVFLLIFGSSVHIGIKQSLLRSRREQSLLILLPGMPQGATLNRFMATRLLRQSAIAWVITATVASQLRYADDDVMWLVAMYAGILPALAFLIQDWSRSEMLRPFKSLSYRVLLGLWVVACYLALSYLHWAPLIVGILSASFSAGLVAWRWQKLATFPSALPAGRLALN